MTHWISLKAAVRDIATRPQSETASGASLGEAVKRVAVKCVRKRGCLSASEFRALAFHGVASRLRRA